jgi:hypothetical protein
MTGDKSFTPKRGRRWPDAIRDQALRAYLRAGPSHAETVTGVPSSTVTMWAKQLGFQPPNREPWNKRAHPLTLHDAEYHRVYFAAYGAGPWSCARCRLPVFAIGRDRGKGNIHHKNHDHDDNRLENLEMLHHECHTMEHRLGRPSPLRHRPHTDEHRRHISEGTPRLCCLGCGKATTLAALTRSHVGRCIPYV